MPDKGKRKAASSAADGAAPAASGKQREEKERAGLDVKQGSEGLPRQDPAAGPVGTKYSSPTMRGSSGKTILISCL